MKNAQPPKPRNLKTLRKRPVKIYEIRQDAQRRWEAYVDGQSQGYFNTIHGWVVGKAVRHAEADAAVGLRVKVETVHPDGRRKVEWQPE